MEKTQRNHDLSINIGNKNMTEEKNEILFLKG